MLGCLESDVSLCAICVVDRHPTIYRYDRSAIEKRITARAIKSMGLPSTVSSRERHEGYLFRDEEKEEHEEIHLVLVLPRGSTQEFYHRPREIRGYGSEGSDENENTRISLN